MTLPTDREIVIYATSEALQHPLAVVLQQEAAKTAGFESLRIQPRAPGIGIPQNAILLVGAGEQLLNREDVTAIPVQQATSLDRLFTLILEAKLGHPIGGLIIRRSQDLRQIFIFA